MRVEHFVLAQNSAVDRDSNALSVFGFLEDLNIQSIQKQVNVAAQAVIVLRKEEAEGPIDDVIRFTVIDPSEKTIVSQVIPLKVSEKHLRQRVRVNFIVVANSSGTYKFRVNRKDDFSAEQSIKINIIPQIAPRNDIPKS